jgi:hypothetical protein
VRSLITPGGLMRGAASRIGVAFGVDPARVIAAQQRPR